MCSVVVIITYNNYAIMNNCKSNSVPLFLEEWELIYEYISI